MDPITQALTTSHVLYSRSNRAASQADVKKELIQITYILLQIYLSLSIKAIVNLFIPVTFGPTLKLIKEVVALNMLTSLRTQTTLKGRLLQWSV